MPQEPTRIVDPYGRGVGYRGAQAGETAKFEAQAESAEREAFRSKHKMAGIGKAGQRAAPEWKTKEEQHIKEWRMARAKRAGQQKAVEAAK